MRYINIDESKPIDGVDVYVVTKSGKKGIARYWNLTGYWLTIDRSLMENELIEKWKYADAI